jgi:APA family basic amino acid/polyamine antiporter
MGRFKPFIPGPGTGGARALLHGSALMFVAFTGYGRIATLGEEVRDPRRVIPRAVIITMIVVSVLYLAVAASGVGVLGASAFGDAAARTAAPLEAVAGALGVPALPGILALAGVTAMTGVLLNLVLGLSLAMARRGDAPRLLARIHEGRGSPVAAVWACGLVVAAITLVGDVRVTWSFSAFTVLVYYAITNLAALRLPPDRRMFPRWISALGLLACLGLAFWVERGIWLLGLGLLAVGIVGHLLARRRSVQA